MKESTLTCIVCPNGCEMKVTLQTDETVIVSGNKCPKGITYAEQEMIFPMRTIATSVVVKNGNMPLVSVRTDGPIPKNQIFNVMKEINSIAVTAPVKVGQVLISDVLSLGCNIIATKQVDIL